MQKPALTLSVLQSGGFVRSLAVAHDQVLPLPLRADLKQFFPSDGLKRGTLVETSSSAVTLALLSEATAQGSWVAVVGAPELGLCAAREHGVALERVVVIQRPPSDQMAPVIAALVDALDIVVVGPLLVQRAADARRLSARARERGAVLLSLGGWPEGPDVSLHVRSQRFNGLSEGHGHLAEWSIDIETSGRGAASRPRRGSLIIAGSANVMHADDLSMPLQVVSVEDTQAADVALDRVG